MDFNATSPLYEASLKSMKDFTIECWFEVDPQCPDGAYLFDKLIGDDRTACRVEIHGGDRAPREHRGRRDGRPAAAHRDDGAPARLHRPDAQAADALRRRGRTRDHEFLDRHRGEQGGRPAAHRGRPGRRPPVRRQGDAARGLQPAAQGGDQCRVRAGAQPRREARVGRIQPLEPGQRDRHGRCPKRGQRAGPHRGAGHADRSGSRGEQPDALVRSSRLGMGAGAAGRQRPPGRDGFRRRGSRGHPAQ